MVRAGLLRWVWWEHYVAVSWAITRWHSRPNHCASGLGPSSYLPLLKENMTLRTDVPPELSPHKTYWVVFWNMCGGEKTQVKYVVVFILVFS